MTSWTGKPILFAFPSWCRVNEIPPFVDLCLRHKQSLFKRITEITGVVFTKLVVNKVHDDVQYFNTEQPFTADSVEKIEILFKRIDVSPFVESLQHGNFDSAEKFYLKEIMNREKSLGKDHIQVAISRRNLAQLYMEQKGMTYKAANEFDQAIAIFLKCGATSEVTETKEKQVDLLLKIDRITEAKELLEVILSDKLATFGKEHLEIANVYDKLARVEVRLGGYDNADKCYARAIEIKQLHFKDPKDQWHIARTMNGQAQMYFNQKQYERAVELSRSVCDILQKARGPLHSEVGIAFDNLAKITSALGNYHEANGLYQLALRIKEGSLGSSHSLVAMTLDHMASNLYKLYAMRGQVTVCQ